MKIEEVQQMLDERGFRQGDGANHGSYPDEEYGLFETRREQHKMEVWHYTSYYSDNDIALYGGGCDPRCGCGEPDGMWRKEKGGEWEEMSQSP